MLRINIITFLIELNEKIFFYPKLKSLLHQLLPSKPLILDVGANKGQSIDFFLSIRPNSTIISFEPNPDLFSFLIEKYKNRQDKIQLVNKGVSANNENLSFHINHLNLTSSFEELNYESDYLAVKSKVLGIKPKEIISKIIQTETITLKMFIQEKGITKIDLLKIDTEGHEFKCLKGLFPLKNCQIDRIQLENHQDDMYVNAESFDEIKKLLTANNYTIEKSIKHGFGNFSEVIFKHSTLI